jgi:hypothetical protein
MYYCGGPNKELAGVLHCQGGARVLHQVSLGFMHKFIFTLLAKQGGFAVHVIERRV